MLSKDDNDSELENKLPSEEELINMIDFINGDYENQSPESLETMYNKLFDYYAIKIRHLYVRYIINIFN